MVFSSFLVCLAHGSNDVANAISPLKVLLDNRAQKDNKLLNQTNQFENKVDYSDKTAFFIGSAGIALGLLILGKKVMLTVGSKIVILDFYKGFTA